MSCRWRSVTTMTCSFMNCLPVEPLGCLRSRRYVSAVITGFGEVTELKPKTLSWFQSGDSDLVLLTDANMTSFGETTRYHFERCYV